MKNLKLVILSTLVVIITSGFLLQPGASKTKKLRHVVAFKFKPEITTEQMQKAHTHFYSLKAQIPEIIEFEGGPDLAYQKKNGKYTHCYIVTVSNEKDLAIYGANPIHKAFSSFVDPMLAEVMVVDYWTE
jgi:hypothetical protein